MSFVVPFHEGAGRMSPEEAAEVARAIPGVVKVTVTPERVERYPATLEITGPPLGEDKAHIYREMERIRTRPGEWDYNVWTDLHEDVTTTKSPIQSTEGDPE